MNFGKKLRELRKEKKMTSVELSKKAGISQSYLSQLETGANTKPTHEILNKLSKALDIDYFDLLIIAGYVSKEDVKIIDEMEDIFNINKSKKRVLPLDKELNNKNLEIKYKNYKFNESDKNKVIKFIDNFIMNGDEN